MITGYGLDRGDRDDDFAARLLTLRVLDRGRDLVHRERAVDHRPHLARVDHVADRHEVVALDAGDEKDDWLLEQPASHRSDSRAAQDALVRTDDHEPAARLEWLQ